MKKTSTDLTIEQRLVNGEILQFEGENHSMEVSFRETLGGSENFMIWFNGAFIKMNKTFKPIEKKMNELISEHQMSTI